MARGYSTPLTVFNSVNLLDLSTVAEAAYFDMTRRIAGISISLCFASAAATADRIVALFKLQVFKGARPSGTGWTGGAWSDLWVMSLSAYRGATATTPTEATTHFSEFDPPIDIGTSSMVLAGGTHAKKDQWIPANTHNAAEVVGETDLRVSLQVIVGAASTDWAACINLYPVAQEE
jgi:hypothetical protein